MPGTARMARELIGHWRQCMKSAIKSRLLVYMTTKADLIADLKQVG